MTDTEGAEVAAVAARLGLESVPEVLRANETAIGRGHHLALVATEGSGVELVYAVASLQAAEADDGESGTAGLSTLVLCATDERAGRVARSLRTALAADTDPVFLATGRWTPADGIPDGTGVLVSRPSRVLPAIRSGHVTTASIRLLVLDDVASLTHLDEWASVEPILETVGSDVRKIAATGRPDAAFRQLLERQLPRARRWPEDLLPISGAEAEAGGGPPLSGQPVRIAVGPASERLALLESCVSAAEASSDTISVICADPHEAAEAASALGVLGRDTTVRGNEVLLGDAGTDAEASARILLGTPTGLPEFSAALEGADLRFVVIEPGRLAHTRILARRAGMPVTPAGAAPLSDPLDAVIIYRGRLEDAIRTTDVVPELLVLEPLIDRYGGARVAAALSALLRRRDSATGPVVPWPDIEAASLGGPTRGGDQVVEVAPRPGRRADSGRRPDRGKHAIPRGARPAWTKLYFGIGKKDDIKPGDLVGAITGETGIVGGQIGKIELRGGFSIVEIDSQVVDEVLGRLQGVTIRGQDVPVRLDRER